MSEISFLRLQKRRVLPSNFNYFVGLSHGQGQIHLRRGAHFQGNIVRNGTLETCGLGFHPVGANDEVIGDVHPGPIRLGNDGDVCVNVCHSHIGIRNHCPRGVSHGSGDVSIELLRRRWN